MAFDWFIFVAQLVNFALLVVLLRLVLYKPVLNLMQQRQDQLDEAWSAAREAEENASVQAAQLQATRSELEGQRRRRLEQVEEEAASLRARRQEELAAEALAERARQAALLDSQRDALVDTFLEKGAEVLVAELTDALQELADESLEERALRLFADRLERLPSDQAALLREQTAAPVVTTAFEPSPAARQHLSTAVQGATGTHGEPVFEVDPSLLFGAALTAGPVRVEASGRRRLKQVGAAFGSALEHPNADLSATKVQDE